MMFVLSEGLGWFCWGFVGFLWFCWFVLVLLGFFFGVVVFNTHLRL